MVSGPLEALAVAFGVIFLAELGDKTQLMLLAFATRYRAVPVVVGVVVASALVMGASVLVGAALGSFVSGQLMQLIGGLIFLVFAAWTLIEREEVEQDVEAVARGRPRPRTWLRASAVVAGAFVLAELGDKSMLAALTLGAQGQPLATWAGATLAEIAVGLIAVVVGRQLGTRLPRRVLRYVGAAAFAMFGVLLVVEGLT
ncbi:MAG: TMEM165/GDT1 family protein [Chloroflexota bacterium]|nr:TMEM165/GDT1 family protein [Chloroflexota bacterium]